MLVHCGVANGQLLMHLGLRTTNLQPAAMGVKHAIQISSQDWIRASRSAPEHAKRKESQFHIVQGRLMC